MNNSIPAQQLISEQAKATSEILKQIKNLEKQTKQILQSNAEITSLLQQIHNKLKY